ncbi:unnamed protein product [Withania somnifera]
MAEIMNKPDVLMKLQQELEAIVGKDNIVEEYHIQQLPYLYAVMKEVLRIHPVVPLLVPHCPSDTCTVGGYTIPKGSHVSVNFHPERFLDNKLDFRGKDFNYFPFGSGGIISVGIAMAERMYMYSVASLVHSFNWRLHEGETLDLTEKLEIVLKKKMPLVAIPTPRLSKQTPYE